MSNLEELDLYRIVRWINTVIDRNNLKKNILNYLSRLNQFIFYISSILSLDDQMNFISIEDNQHTFIDFPNNKIVSYVDYFLKAQEIHCHMYTYPFLMKYFDEITNNFPSGLFNYLHVMSLLTNILLNINFFSSNSKIISLCGTYNFNFFTRMFSLCNNIFKVILKDKKKLSIKFKKINEIMSVPT